MTQNIAHIDPFYFSLKNGEVDSRFKYLRAKSTASAIALSAGETWSSQFIKGVFGIVKNASPPGSISIGPGSTTYQTVTGVGTAFLTDFVAGDYIHVPAFTAWARIFSVNSNTDMTTTVPWNFGTGSGLAYHVYSYFMGFAGVAQPPDLPLFVDL